MVVDQLCALGLLFFALITTSIPTPQAMASPSYLPSNASAAAAFEKSLWTNGPVSSDSFYTAPTSSTRAAPGTLLKLETDANASTYTLAPGTAISRIMFQSETLQGAPIPASAYILWPYQPRTQPDGTYPVVAWAHGTSGIYGNCAPSHIKTLYQHFDAPFPLALQGYVTVAPDYVGLGVDKTTDGKDIVHQYIANPAHANDLFYAVQAAQVAFSQLSSEFVVIGHSQGGGAAWGAAQRQAIKPVKGYLGSIALSPVTDILELPPTDNPLIPILGAFMAPGIQTVFPQFEPREIFTDAGWERWQMYSQAGGCNPVAVELLAGIQLLNDDWRSNTYLQQYIQLTLNGGKEIGGPLLVIQGEADPNMNVTTTTSAVNKLVQAFPDAQVEYVTLPGITHTPSLFASQRLWLDWIASRFAGVEVKSGYQHSEASSLARPISSYQSDANWIITPATESYQLA